MVKGLYDTRGSETCKWLEAHVRCRAQAQVPESCRSTCLTSSHDGGSTVPATFARLPQAAAADPVCMIGGNE